MATKGLTAGLDGLVDSSTLAILRQAQDSAENERRIEHLSGLSYFGDRLGDALGKGLAAITNKIGITAKPVDPEADNATAVDQAQKYAKDTLAAQQRNAEPGDGTADVTTQHVATMKLMVKSLMDSGHADLAGKALQNLMTYQKGIAEYDNLLAEGKGKVLANAHQALQNETDTEVQAFDIAGRKGKGTSEAIKGAVDVNSQAFVEEKAKAEATKATSEASKAKMELANYPALSAATLRGIQLDGQIKQFTVNNGGVPMDELAQAQSAGDRYTVQLAKLVKAGVKPTDPVYANAARKRDEVQDHIDTYIHGKSINTLVDGNATSKVQGDAQETINATNIASESLRNLREVLGTGGASALGAVGAVRTTASRVVGTAGEQLHMPVGGVASAAASKPMLALRPAAASLAVSLGNAVTVSGRQPSAQTTKLISDLNDIGTAAVSDRRSAAATLDEAEKLLNSINKEATHALTPGAYAPSNDHSKAWDAKTAEAALRARLGH